MRRSYYELEREDGTFDLRYTSDKTDEFHLICDGYKRISRHEAFRLCNTEKMRRLTDDKLAWLSDDTVAPAYVDEDQLDADYFISSEGIWEMKPELVAQADMKGW